MSLPIMSSVPSAHQAGPVPNERTYYRHVYDEATGKRYRLSITEKVAGEEERFLPVSNQDWERLEKYFEDNRCYQHFDHSAPLNKLSNGVVADGTNHLHVNGTATPHVLHGGRKHNDFIRTLNEASSAPESLKRTKAELDAHHHPAPVVDNARPGTQADNNAPQPNAVEQQARGLLDEARRVPPNAQARENAANLAPQVRDPALRNELEQIAAHKPAFPLYEEAAKTIEENGIIEDDMHLASLYVTNEVKDHRVDIFTNGGKEWDTASMGHADVSTFAKTIAGRGIAGEPGDLHIERPVVFPMKRASGEHALVVLDSGRSDDWTVHFVSPSAAPVDAAEKLAIEQLISKLPTALKKQPKIVMANTSAHADDSSLWCSVYMEELNRRETTKSTGLMGLFRDGRDDLDLNRCKMEGEYRAHLAKRNQEYVTEHKKLAERTVEESKKKDPKTPLAKALKDKATQSLEGSVAGDKLIALPAPRANRPHRIQLNEQTAMQIAAGNSHCVIIGEKEGAFQEEYELRTGHKANVPADGFYFAQRVPLLTAGANRHFERNQGVDQTVGCVLAAPMTLGTDRAADLIAIKKHLFNQLQKVLPDGAPPTQVVLIPPAYYKDLAPLDKVAVQMVYEEVIAHFGGKISGVVMAESNPPDPVVLGEIKMLEKAIDDDLNHIEHQRVNAEELHRLLSKLIHLKNRIIALELQGYRFSEGKIATQVPKIKAAIAGHINTIPMNGHAHEFDLETNRIGMELNRPDVDLKELKERIDHELEILGYFKTAPWFDGKQTQLVNHFITCNNQEIQQFKDQIADHADDLDELNRIGNQLEESHAPYQNVQQISGVDQFNEARKIQVEEVEQALRTAFGSEYEKNIDIPTEVEINGLMQQIAVSPDLHGLQDELDQFIGRLNASKTVLQAIDRSTNCRIANSLLDDTGLLIQQTQDHLNLVQEQIHNRGLALARS
jgi:hypothetical protein